MAKPRPVEPMDEILPFIETAPIAEACGLFANGLKRIGLETENLKIRHGLRYYSFSDSRRADVAALLARQEAALATLGGPVDLASLVARALDILKGDDRTFEPTPNDRHADLERAEPIVREAFGVAQQQAETLRQERSRPIADELKPQHDELLVAIYHTAQAHAVAGEREREFKAKLLALGYSAPSDLLPSPLLGSLLALGVEQNPSSQLAAYRRWLQTRGLLS
jgi:hypothetical protein